MIDRFVIMGVAGSGKTSVGNGLARITGLSYFDGDDLHSKENIAKMSAGTPLTDADRAPWLAEIGQKLGAATSPIAIGCSALKRQYRDTIRQEAGGKVGFIHLAAAQFIIANRMKTRDGHFMPNSLLDSQFAALEQLGKDEDGYVVDIGKPLEDVINEAAIYVKGVL